MTSAEHDEFCKSYLTGETILWEGAPEKGSIFMPQDWFLIPFSLFWLGFSLFWEVSAIASTGSWMMAIFGFPFVAVGLYLLVGRFLHRLLLRGKTYYIITDRKILIRSGSRIRLYPARNLPPMDIRIHRNGNGTILFYGDISGTGHRNGIYFMLENIADVAGAQDAINRMKA